jgi:RluA family pseudouridine synthase
MSQTPKPFKRPPKKHQPKGLSVLYEDNDILVVEKASGLLTVSTDKVQERTAYYLLTDYVRKGMAKSNRRIFIVHRLDRDTSGVLVFAKHEVAKRYLQDNWGDFTKRYYAIVEGRPPEREGIISSYLAESETHRIYSVADPRLGKLSKTAYRVVREGAGRCMLEIDLLTGRKNQIRVHLADKGCPVVGDGKYGRGREKGIRRLALHAASMTIAHPHTKEPMTFESPVPSYLYGLLKPRRQD